MNKRTKVFAFYAALFAIASCKKEKVYKSDGAATIQVVNAAVDVPTIQLNMYNLPITYRTATKVNYGASAFYYARKTTTPISVVSSADTTTFLVNKSYDLPGKIYTLYITGRSTAIDTIFREETVFPYFQLDKIPTDADSVVNVRFVNLSPNSVPLSINILGSTANEVANFSYKSISNFKVYTAKIANPNYKFEIRDAATNSLLFTYTFNVTGTNRFRNVALVVRGLQGTTSGASAFGVSAVNYFQ